MSCGSRVGKIGWDWNMAGRAQKAAAIAIFVRNDDAPRGSTAPRVTWQRHVTRTSKTFRDATPPPLFPTPISLSLSLCLPFSPFSSLEPNNPRIIRSTLSRIFRSYLSIRALLKATCAFCEFAFANLYRITIVVARWFSFLSRWQKKIFPFPFLFFSLLSYLLFAMFVRKYKERRSCRSMPKSKRGTVELIPKTGVSRGISDFIHAREEKSRIQRVMPPLAPYILWWIRGWTCRRTDVTLTFSSYFRFDVVAVINVPRRHWFNTPSWNDRLAGAS